MARDVNWWLMSLAFLLGLLLTLALTIRKVTREVPVSRTVEVPKPHLDKPALGKVAGAVTATGAGAAAALHGAAEKVADKVEHVEHTVVEKVEHVEHKVVEKVEHAEHKNTGAFEHVEHVLEHEPYGAGSIRVSARTAAPAGYTIKGDKDTGRYFTLDSPQYASVEAEVWFANDESAEKAGFVRWDAADLHRVGLVSADAAAVVSEAHHVVADAVITEAPHVSAETVITENSSSAADSTLVIIDDGIPEAESRIKIIGAD
jgi:hypothetical protein